MIVSEWLKESVQVLNKASVPSARLDCLILLEDTTGKDRGWLLAHPEFVLRRSDLRKLDEQIERRAGHEPLAYIRGKSEFYGREFKVTPATLQPRPETETLVTLLRNVVASHKSPVASTSDKRLETDDFVLVDVGSGSGCLAITAKLEWPEAEVYATEINAGALKVARQNAKNLKADVIFMQGNLLQPYSALSPQLSALFAVLANLPYVPDSHTINRAAMQEPRIAIFGGEDGLDLYRALFEQLEKREERKEKRIRPEYILTESLPFQHQALKIIAKKAGYTQINEEDFIQVFSASRVVR